MDPSVLRQTYDQDGYVIARNVIDADLAAETADHVQWLLVRNPGVRPEKLGHPLLVHDPFINITWSETPDYSTSLSSLSAPTSPCSPPTT